MKTGKQKPLPALPKPTTSPGTSTRAVEPEVDDKEASEFLANDEEMVSLMKEMGLEDLI